MSLGQIACGVCGCVRCQCLARGKDNDKGKQAEEPIMTHKLQELCFLSHFIYTHKDANGFGSNVMCLECYEDWNCEHATPLESYRIESSEHVECGYCTSYYDREELEMKAKPLPIMCADCYLDADESDDAGRTQTLALQPIGTGCDFCGDIKTDQKLVPASPANWFYHLYTQRPCNNIPNAITREARQDKAHHVAEFISSHGMPAHATLTGMVRALDGYTYRDDNNTLCVGEEWALLDPQQADVIYEFLGY